MATTTFNNNNNNDIDLIPHITLYNVHIYNIPPLQSSTGYSCKSWDITKPTWSGILKLSTNIKNNNNNIYIEFYDKINTNQLFLCSLLYNEQSITPCIDSSRYFVVRVVNNTNDNNKQQSTNIGIGFNTRNDSFDFKTTLQDLFNHNHNHSNNNTSNNTINNNDSLLKPANISDDNINNTGNDTNNNNNNQNNILFASTLLPIGNNKLHILLPNTNNNSSIHKTSHNNNRHNLSNIQLTAPPQPNAHRTRVNYNTHIHNDNNETIESPSDTNDSNNVDANNILF